LLEGEAGVHGGTVVMAWLWRERAEPLATPPVRGEVGAPLSTRRRVELLGGVLYHGPPGEGVLLWVEPMKVAPESLLLGEMLRTPK
jgi:hypothetical protein